MTKRNEIQEIESQENWYLKKNGKLKCFENSPLLFVFHQHQVREKGSVTVTVSVGNNIRINNF